MSDDMEAAIAAGSTMVVSALQFLVRVITLKNKELKNAMNTLTFLLSTVIELYTMVCYYASGCSGLIVIFTTPSHSCSEGNAANYRATAPRYSGNGPIDSASLLVAYILSFIKAICCLKW